MQSCSPSVQTMPDRADMGEGEVRPVPPVHLFCSWGRYFLFLTAAAVEGINL